VIRYKSCGERGRKLQEGHCLHWPNSLGDSRPCELALRENEQRMELAASAADLGLWVWDVEQDAIWATDKARALFGLSSAEAVDFARFVQSVHPEDRAVVKEVVAAHQNACRLRANESVAARIEELRARNAEKCQLSRDEAVQYLVEILKTPIGEVTSDHRLAQSHDAKSGKIELPTSSARCSSLPKCADGRSRTATKSTIISRSSRNSLKSSLG
jgi:PAS domain-containing protein